MFSKCVCYKGLSNRKLYEMSLICFTLFLKSHLLQRIQVFTLCKGMLNRACVDLKQAFDSIYHNGLRIKGKLLRIVWDMYSSVELWVRSCNNYSECFECAVALKQGDISSAIMFSLFREDLELFLKDNINSGLTIDDITFIFMLFIKYWCKIIDNKVSNK